MKISRTHDFNTWSNLFRLAFPENKEMATEEHYNWKFDNAIEYGAYDNGMIGYYAAIPYVYIMDSKVVIAGMVCDVMTHPDRRNNGVFKKMGDYATRDMAENRIDFVTGYPIRKEVLPGHLKVGWKVAFKLPMYFKLGLFDWFHFKGNRYSTEILNRDEFIKMNGYGTFFVKWRYLNQNVLVKTKEFISWRTGGPGTDYKFIVIRDKGIVRGLAITRETILKGLKVTAILDIMILDKACLKYIYGAIKGNAVVMASKVTAGRLNFFRNGFLRTPFVFKLIFKRLNKSIKESEFDIKRWSLMWVDSDDL